MTSDYAITRRRAYKRESNRRHRLRKAGLLPPVPTCDRCGGKVNSTRWLPLCWTCAAAATTVKHRRRVARLADQIIQELRSEKAPGSHPQGRHDASPDSLQP